MFRTMLKTALTTTALVAVAASPSLGASLKKAKDETRISMSGTVEQVHIDAFTLDYDGGAVLVEMDDWDDFDEAQALRAGDKVTVYGRIDADLFEERKIEADTVYSHTYNAYYHASDMDEETTYRMFIKPQPLEDGTEVGTYGVITKLDPNDSEFLLDTDYGQIQVDTTAMKKSPVDGKGLVQLAKGDEVMVIGELDYGFFERREIIAETVAQIVDMSVTIVEQ